MTKAAIHMCGNSSAHNKDARDVLHESNMTDSYLVPTRLNIRGFDSLPLLCALLKECLNALTTTRQRSFWEVQILMECEYCILRGQDLNAAFWKAATIAVFIPWSSWRQ